MKAPNSSGVLENPSKPTFLKLAWLSMTARSAVLGGPRRAGRHPGGGRGIEIEAFDSGLVHGRQVRIERTALYARYRQRPHGACFDVRYRGGEISKHHRHAAGDDVHKRRSCGFVRHMQHADLAHFATV
jgi:hypothetical protein